MRRVFFFAHRLISRVTISSRYRVTIFVFVPSLGVHFESLPPFHQLAIVIPVDVAVEWCTDQLAPRPRAALVNVPVIVGKVEVSVADDAFTAAGRLNRTLARAMIGAG